MTKVVIDGVERHFDEYLKRILDKAKENQKRKLDFLLGVGGKEGFGKSCMVSQIAKYLQPDFDQSRQICWDTKSYLKLLDDSDKYDVCWLDEGWFSMSNAQANKTFQAELINRLTTVRSKCLFMVMICPTFFDLSKYFPMHRMNGFIRVRMKKGQRGMFQAYGGDKMKTLYLQGREKWNYNVVKPDFVGKFLNWWGIDEPEYDRIKLERTKSHIDDDPKEFFTKMPKDLLWGIRADVMQGLRDDKLLKPGYGDCLARRWKLHPSTVSDRLHSGARYMGIKDIDVTKLDEFTTRIPLGGELPPQAPLFDNLDGKNDQPLLPPKGGKVPVIKGSTTIKKEEPI